MRALLIGIFAVTVVVGAVILFLRKGESVTYTSDDGTQTEDIRKITGHATYQVREHLKVSQEAQLLHEEGRRLGSQRKYDEALAAFRKASVLAPDWPYPPYDAAFTYLLQKKPDLALQEYRRTDKLAPEGFFTAKTAIWALEREEQGLLPKGIYLAYLSLEDISDPTKRRASTKAIADSTPTFAPIWKSLAYLTNDPKEKLLLIEKGLALGPDAETLGMLLINKATVLDDLGKKTESHSLLKQLAQDETQTFGTKTMAAEVLKAMRAIRP